MVSGFEDREIPEKPADRPPPPDDVFCLTMVDSWRNRIWRMLGDVVTSEVKDAFIANPPEYVVSDDLTWLDDIVFEATGLRISVQ